MGKLRIFTAGSFQTLDVEYSAIDSGHAVAVDNAIHELTRFREGARAQDILLRRRGIVPRDNFAEAYRRGLLKDGGGNAKA